MRGPRQRRALLALACGVVVLLAGVLAARAATVRDREDTGAGVDIARASGAHNRTSDRLVHVIETREDFGPATFLNESGPPGSVCVNVWTSRDPGEDPPNYDVCATSDRSGENYRASITRHGGAGSLRRVGSADLKQPSPRRIELRVDPDRVRRPDSYRWSAQTTTFAEDCPKGTGCEDLAPDRPDTERTRLGTPRG